MSFDSVIINMNKKKTTPNRPGGKYLDSPIAICYTDTVSSCGWDEVLSCNQHHVSNLAQLLAL